jgi:hypothetical protein
METSMTNVTNMLLAQLLMQRPQNGEPNAEPTRPFANTRARAAEGFRQGFGDRELGIPADVLARYPQLGLLQDDARIVDGLTRSWSGLLRGGAGFAGGLSQDMGLNETDSRRLQREFNALGDIFGARRLGR